MKGLLAKGKGALERRIATLSRRPSPWDGARPTRAQPLLRARSALAQGAVRWRDSARKWVSGRTTPIGVRFPEGDESIRTYLPPVEAPAPTAPAPLQWTKRPLRPRKVGHAKLRKRGAPSDEAGEPLDQPLDDTFLDVGEDELAAGGRARSGALGERPSDATHLAVAPRRQPKLRASRPHARAGFDAARGPQRVEEDLSWDAPLVEAPVGAPPGDDVPRARGPFGRLREGAKRLRTQAEGAIRGRLAHLSGVSGAAPGVANATRRGPFAAFPTLDPATGLPARSPGVRTLPSPGLARSGGDLTWVPTPELEPERDPEDLTAPPTRRPRAARASLPPVARGPAPLRPPSPFTSLSPDRATRPSSLVNDNPLATAPRGSPMGHRSRALAISARPETVFVPGPEAPKEQPGPEPTGGAPRWRRPEAPPDPALARRRAERGLSHEERVRLARQRMGWSVKAPTPEPGPGEAPTGPLRSGAAPSSARSRSSSLPTLARRSSAPGTSQGLLSRTLAPVALGTPGDAPRRARSVTVPSQVLTRDVPAPEVRGKRSATRRRPSLGTPDLGRPGGPRDDGAPTRGPEEIDGSLGVGPDDVVPPVLEPEVPEDLSDAPVDESDAPEGSDANRRVRLSDQRGTLLKPGSGAKVQGSGTEQVLLSAERGGAEPDDEDPALDGAGALPKWRREAIQQRQQRQRDRGDEAASRGYRGVPWRSHADLDARLQASKTRGARIARGLPFWLAAEGEEDGDGWRFEVFRRLNTDLKSDKDLDGWWKGLSADDRKKALEPEKKRLDKRRYATLVEGKFREGGGAKPKLAPEGLSADSPLSKRNRESGEQVALGGGDDGERTPGEGGAFTTGRLASVKGSPEMAMLEAPTEEGAPDELLPGTDGERGWLRPRSGQGRSSAQGRGRAGAVSLGWSRSTTRARSGAFTARGGPGGRTTSGDLNALRSTSAPLRRPSARLLPKATDQVFVAATGIPGGPDATAEHATREDGSAGAPSGRSGPSASKSLKERLGQALRGRLGKSGGAGARGSGKPAEPSASPDTTEPSANEAPASLKKRFKAKVESKLKEALQVERRRAEARRPARAPDAPLSERDVQKQVADALQALVDGTPEGRQLLRDVLQRLDEHRHLGRMRQV